ncbi:FMN-binding negative transcriptional regulator [Neptunicoccus cionae]|uniref:FMN-binding negative transcriptional regulator n=1 Tax=Neptunicoccus cionae TaxID=2035344 RepID=UPI000C77156A|nr:FMN-binding negative transcriptional regulator [Amylibacter cionae]PLS23049.1 negative transcriptional regulator [Amylibacter cionae]
MHPNPAFRKANQDANLAFARQRAFGALAVNGPEGPLLAHIPFQLSEDGRRLEAHLVRSNPLWRLLQQDGPQQAVVAVGGADSYISPDWYGLDDQVPTWNYVAVHLRGRLHALPQQELEGILNRLSAAMEMRLAPKPVWAMDKMGGGIAERMMRMIAPVAMDVTQVDGTWKLGQNKPEAVRITASGQVAEHGIGQEIGTLAGLMKDPPC